MQNLTEFPVNATSRRSLPLVMKVCAVIPFFCVFLCFFVVMLHIFASHRQFLDVSRYILFVHMLISDALHLLCSMMLFFLAIGRVKFAIIFCTPLLFITSVTFHNTPLILATMSLERYVAILYPLQCPAAWRSDRIWIIALSLWLISCIYPVLLYAMREPDPAENVFVTIVICQVRSFYSSTLQILFKMVISVLYFTLVASIILFTYVRILMEVNKLGQERASVIKAMRTVMLHGFQLLLCLFAYTHPLTESVIIHAHLREEDVAFLNFFCFIIIPRFLSPLIYGFRDESLRGYIGSMFLHMFSCNSKKIKPNMKACGKIQDK